MALPLVHSQILWTEGKGRYQAPFRPEEWLGRVGQDVAALIDELLEFEGLPEIGVEEAAVARQDRL